HLILTSSSLQSFYKNQYLHSFPTRRSSDLTAYSDKVKSDLEVPAKRHMKNVEVPTGEKSMFDLGKEIMKTEKKPTKNVVISERDYKNLVTAARDNDKLKQHVRNLM